MALISQPQGLVEVMLVLVLFGLMIHSVPVEVVVEHMVHHQTLAQLVEMEELVVVELVALLHQRLLETEEMDLLTPEVVVVEVPVIQLSQVMEVMVILRYAGSQRGTGGTITASGGYTYHTFNSSGTYTG